MKRSPDPGGDDPLEFNLSTERLPCTRRCTVPGNGALSDLPLLTGSLREGPSQSPAGIR